MKIKYRLSLIIVGLLMVFSITICSSYSYWTLTQNQEDINILETGCLNIDYNDMVGGESTSIDLSNSFPISDDAASNLAPYKVTLTNNCTIKAKYTLLLITDDANTLNDDKIKINLKVSEGESIISNNLLSSLNTTNTFDELTYETITSQGLTINNTYELTSNMLEPTETITLNMNLWVDENTTNIDMNKIFKASIISYQEAADIY